MLLWNVAILFHLNCKNDFRNILQFLENNLSLNHDDNFTDLNVYNEIYLEMNINDKVDNSFIE